MKDLRPYNAIAYYFGCDYALYFSSLSLIASYTILVTLLGAIIYVVFVII